MIYLIALFLAVLVSSSEGSNNEEDSNLGVGLMIASGLFVLLGASFALYLAAQKRTCCSSSDEDENYDLELSPSLSEVFPDMKPAFERYPSELSTFSAENTPRQSTPYTPKKVLVQSRHGSMQILQEVHDRQLDLEEDCVYDEYGGKHVRAHSVIFAEDNLNGQVAHNRNDFDFHEEN